MTYIRGAGLEALARLAARRNSGTTHSTSISTFTSTMVSRHVLELCTSPTTLTSELAKRPDQPISRVARRLFKNHGAIFKRLTDAPPVEDEEDKLGIVARCGSFPHRPSDLFLLVSYYCIIISKVSHNPLIR
jgi:hypothetical protein